MKQDNCQYCESFDVCDAKDYGSHCYKDEMKNVVMRDTPPEIVYELMLRHFKISERFAEFARGSIANYLKLKIYSPRKMTSVEDSKQHLAYFVKLESHCEPGYIECDLHKEEEFFIRGDKLIQFLKDKHVFTDDEQKSYIEEVQRKIRERAMKKHESVQ